MYRNESIELVYCIARLRGVNIGPRKAVLIVGKFTHEELEQIYRLTKEKGVEWVSSMVYGTLIAE
jgi:hypothetical protein